MAKSKKPRPETPLAIDPNSRATVSGPADPKPLVDSSDDLTAKMAATQQLAAALPFNANKALEYDPEAAIRPEPGVSIEPADPIVGSSTVQEKNGSDKVGSGGPVIGENKTNGPLDRVRVDSSKRTLTTNQGVPVADNQNSLKAGLRGPTLLEDFILREKITHFDHERIPERIVHARGSAAHGIFQCTKALGELTKASLFAEVGKETPVFVRFSTVLGERGSTDTARDVRGFAVKFYTDEGNWDLVGNNIPVFFIQDAMKFPDLVHAAKPEPHFAMPQAGTAHDTFWDFASLMPEITHMLMWAMSDRAIPRSYRMMQGFGVHSFRLVNDAGESTFVKFHWNPVAGTHSLVWDEAVKISGADPDFHRRDLWEAIEAGAYPEWELALQIFTEAQAEAFSFDILDATKIVPEELVPLDAGRASGAQSQPGQLLRRDGAGGLLHGACGPRHRFFERSPVGGTHSFVRRHADLAAGRSELPRDPDQCARGGGAQQPARWHAPASHQPRSRRLRAELAGWGMSVSSRRQRIRLVRRQDGARGQQAARQARAVCRALRAGAPVPRQSNATRARAHHQRVSLRAVAGADPRGPGADGVRPDECRSRVRRSGGDGSWDAHHASADAQGARDGRDARGRQPHRRCHSWRDPAMAASRRRRIAILVAEGAESQSLEALASELLAAGAVPRFVGARLGEVTLTGGARQVDTTVEAMPSVLWDAVVIPDGDDAVEQLGIDGRVLEFVKDQYRHCKPILAIGSATGLLQKAGVPETLVSGQADPGLLLMEGDDATGIAAFIAAIAKHRHFERETDPPRV